MKRHLLTAALAIVALGGAVASATNSKLVPTPGSPFNAVAPCTQSVGDCNPSGTVACTDNATNTIPLYGKDPFGSRCIVQLLKFP